MREIKFRAWDGLRMTLTGISFSNSTGSVLIPPRWILMQYTGLKDKKGKEIYEGDIVKGKFMYKVEWYHLGRWYVIPLSNRGFCHTPDIWNEYEVIGNIYENPELLEKNE